MQEKMQLYCFENENGVKAKFTDFGASVVAVEVPDRDGHVENVVLRFEALAAYQTNPRLLGSTVGRYCGRISHAQFDLCGETYYLPKNHGAHHIHGGVVGFSHVLWQAESFTNGVSFSYRSESGEQGYPGNLDVKVCYFLTNENQLICEYFATTDESTPINLTNHSYWNLGGSRHTDIFDHRVEINARHYIETDQRMLPTGKLLPTSNTALDFSAPREIGKQMKKLERDTQNTMGFDHCFVVHGPASTLNLAAKVTDPTSGRMLTVETTQPGIQFYTAGFLDGSDACGGHGKHAGLCLETQHFPDSPNHAHFPTTILSPGEIYHQTTVFSFEVQ